MFDSRHSIVITAVVSLAFSFAIVDHADAGAIALAGGGRHGMLLKADGTLYGWGDSQDGAVGANEGYSCTGNIQNTFWTPVKVTGITSTTALSASTMNSAAVCNGGSICVWGNNDRGQLGQGNRCRSGAPIQATYPGGGIGFKSIASSDALVTLVVGPDGSLATTGAGGGPLGYGAPGQPDVLSLRAVPGISGLQSVAAGQAHAIALQNDGTVLSWGRNDSGQLGVGSTTGNYTPSAVPGLSGVVAIAAAGEFSLALKGDGTVYGWGRFVGTAQQSAVQTSPTLVSGLASVTRIAAGQTHALALRSDGSVWAWGLNSYGEVGDGTKVTRISPVKVLDNALAIAAGEVQSYAVGSDFAVRSWGWNWQGALGLGSSVSEALTPTRMALYADVPPAPPNDNFAGRQLLSGASGVVEGTLAGATREAGEPAEGGSSTSISIWYRWVAPAAGQVTLTASGNIPVAADAYVGNSVSGLTKVGTGLFQAEAGKEYQIAVYNTTGAFGVSTLGWSLNTSASADLLVSQSASGSRDSSGTYVTFVVSVKNLGPNTATGVTFSGAVPANTQVIPMPSACSQQGNTLTCNLADIGSGLTASKSIPMRSLVVPQKVTNTVTASSQVFDPNVGNNNSSLSFQVTVEDHSNDDAPTAPEWAMILLGATLMFIKFSTLR